MNEREFHDKPFFVTSSQYPRPEEFNASIWDTILKNRYMSGFMKMVLKSEVSYLSRYILFRFYRE